MAAILLEDRNFVGEEHNLPFKGFESTVSYTPLSCDQWTLQHRTYDNLHSYRATIVFITQILNLLFT